MINNARDRPQSISLPVHSHPNGGRPLPHSLPGNDPEILRLKVENETLEDSLEVSEAKWRSLDEAQGQGKRIRELNSALHNSRMEVKRLNTIIMKGYAPSRIPLTSNSESNSATSGAPSSRLHETITKPPVCPCIVLVKKQQHWCRDSNDG